jgi:hypothetical protein
VTIHVRREDAGPGDAVNPSILTTYFAGSGDELDGLTSRFEFAVLTSCGSWVNLGVIFALVYPVAATFVALWLQ